MRPLIKSNGGRRGAYVPEPLEVPRSYSRAAEGPPPTLADLQLIGVHGFIVTCSSVTCRHQGNLRFADLDLPDATVFIDLPSCPRFVCTGCQARKIEVFPNWSGFTGTPDGHLGTWGMRPPGLGSACDQSATQLG